MPRSRYLIGKRLFDLAPVLAAVVFGSWAAFVNNEYGLTIAIRSGLGQAAYALVSTWIVTRTAGNVSLLCGKGLPGYIAGFVASFLVMISIPLAIHYMLGTPEVFAAVLPGVLWGSGYIGSYLWFFSMGAPDTGN